MTLWNGADPDTSRKTPFTWAVPSAGGSICEYDVEWNIDRCGIWNREGVVLEYDEFVTYDGGRPARSDELRIVDPNSGPDRIELQNGRVLIPRRREVEMKRFLDWQNGKRLSR